MKTMALTIALLLSGAAIAQTTPPVDVDADVGVQPDGDLDVDADVDVNTQPAPQPDVSTQTTTHGTTTQTTTTHGTMSNPPTMASNMSAGGQIAQPSNANPEHDARGIAVISDPAVVPAGFNGAGTAVGGPLVDATTGEAVNPTDSSHPPCTREVTDNCVQTYERGRSPQ